MRTFYYIISLMFLFMGLQMSYSPVFSGCRDAHPVTGPGPKHETFSCPKAGVQDACSLKITGVPGAYCNLTKDKDCPDLQLGICYVNE